MLVQKFARNPVVSYLSEISFEIYIVHYWFFNGKWQIFNWVSNKILGYTIAIALTVVFAILLHISSRFVVTIFFDRKEISYENSSN